jgi:hypothetical protein
MVEPLTATTNTATEAVTEGSKNSNQEVESKVYTQAELDAIAAEVRRKTETKVAKKYDGIDIEKYRSLMQKEEELKMQQAKEKGEFEKILREQSEKANQKISTLTQQLTRIQVDGTLLSLASNMKAINPEQVVKLVKDQIKMSETGEVEVIDPKTGQTRYKDSGEAMTSADLLTEFLKANAHFVTAGPAGAGIKSNTSNNGIPQVDLNNLDMKNPEHRKIYAQYRKAKGIGY